MRGLLPHPHQQHVRVHSRHETSAAGRVSLDMVRYRARPAVGRAQLGWSSGVPVAGWLFYQIDHFRGFGFYRDRRLTMARRPLLSRAIAVSLPASGYSFDL